MPTKSKAKKILSEENMKFKDQLEDQLKKAEKIEMEHLREVRLREGLKNSLNQITGAIDTKKEKKAAKNAARIIGKAHLKESKRYYDFLDKMEKQF